MDLILTSLRENGFNAQQDSFGDKSCAWIELTKKTQKPSLVTVNICFDYEERNRITEINIYENPIITIVDEEKTTVIVNI